MKYLRYILLCVLAISLIMIPTVQVSASDELSYPVLKDNIQYFQTSFPPGLRYSDGWYGTFTYAPTAASIILFDDDKGICVFAMPVGIVPSGEQGGTTLKAITKKEVDDIVKAYPVKELVEAYDPEITDIMEMDDYFNGAQAGDKLRQKFNQPKNLSQKQMELSTNSDIPLNEPVLTERQIEAKAAFELARTTQGIVDLAKFDPDRYFVMGQCFFTDGTANCSLDGRQVADSAFTVDGAGNFTIHMASGTTGTVSGTNVSGTPVTLAAGLNTITCTDAVADGAFDITIGTAANWNTVNSWSASSGGACTASVPTSADNVFFDALSFTAGSQVLTVDATVNCLAMDWTGATNTPTLAFGTGRIQTYGNTITFIDEMIVTYSTGNMLVVGGNPTITSNTSSMCGLRADSAYTGLITLANDYATTTDMLFIKCTLVSDNNTISAGAITLSGTSGTQTLTLGSSIINCTSWAYTGSNLTVSANTATINVSGTGAFAGGSPTGSYYDINLTGSAHTVSGTFTCHILNRHPTSHVNTDTLTLTSGTTITVDDTFVVDGGARATSLLVQSSTLGAAATVSAAAVLFLNCDFMDITGSGAATWDLSAQADIGNCGGNTFKALGDAAFPAADDQTSKNTDAWNLVTGWTGTVADRIPLPQDNVTCSHSKTVNMLRIGKSITFTGTPTITKTNAINIYGSFTLVSGMTYTGNYAEYLRGRVAGLTITLEGTVKFYVPYFYGVGGTYTVYTNGGLLAQGVPVITYGTVIFDGQTFSVQSIQINGTAILNITNSTINLTYIGTPIWSINPANTLISTNSTLILTNSTANAQTFVGGGKTYNNVTVSGAGDYALTVTGNNTFNTFKVDDSLANKTIIGTGTTQTVGDFQKDNGGTGVTTITGGTWTKHGRLATVTGTFTDSPVYFNDLNETIYCTVTGTATVTLPYGVTGTATSVVGGATVTDSPKALVAGTNTISVTAGGTNDFTITTNSIDSIPIALDYLSVSGSTAIPANVWYAGSNSADGGGNSNWLFDDPALSVTSNACTGVTMNKDGVTGGVFNGTINTLLEGTPTITTYFEYGLTNAYGSQTSNVIIYDDTIFTGVVPTGLTPGSTYHFRAVATNGNAGSPFNGLDSTFVFTLPIITTQAASSVTMDKDGVTGGTFNGNVTNMGVASNTYVYADYGLTALYGSSTTNSTVSGTGAFTIIIPVSNMTPGATYHYRVNTLNGVIASNGNDQSFTFTMPSITSSDATNIESTKVTLNGNISDMGVATNSYIYFEYGLTNAYGTSTPQVTISAIGDYSTNLTGLTGLSLYYYRMNVVNGATTSNGSAKTVQLAYAYNASTNTFANLLLPLIFVVIMVIFALKLIYNGSVIQGMILLLVVILIGLSLLASMQVTLNGL